MEETSQQDAFCIQATPKMIYRLLYPTKGYLPGFCVNSCSSLLVGKQSAFLKSLSLPSGLTQLHKHIWGKWSKYFMSKQLWLKKKPNNSSFIQSKNLNKDMTFLFFFQRIIIIIQKTMQINIF